LYSNYKPSVSVPMKQLHDRSFLPQIEADKDKRNPGSSVMKRGLFFCPVS